VNQVKDRRRWRWNGWKVEEWPARWPAMAPEALDLPAKVKRESKNKKLNKIKLK
jgi:hypothetical protein